jgi:hypothetical protein
MTGVALVILGLLWPRALSVVHRAWMAVGHALGWVNTRILLGIVFYGIVTPMGLVMRLAGRDPMRRGFDAMASSYRVPRAPRPSGHLTRQF